MSAGSFKLNLVRSSGSKIKSREWGEKKKTALSLGREKKITLIYFFKKKKPKKTNRVWIRSVCPWKQLVLEKRRICRRLLSEEVTDSRGWLRGLDAAERPT